MTSLPLRPRVGLVRRAIRAVLPWLCSTSCHAGLVAGLLATWQWAWLPDAPGGRPLSTASETSVTWEIGNASLELEAVSADTPQRRFDENAARESLTRQFVGETAADDPDPAQAVGLLDEPREILVASFDAPPDDRAVEPARHDSGRTAERDVDGDSGSPALPSGTTRTGVFGASGVGRKFVYVFDRSASMDGHGGAPLAAAKRELITSLADLDQTHQFQIIFYNERPRVFSPTGVLGRLVFGTDQNKNLAEKFVGSITADGATRHEEALAMALKMAPDVIFFLTDADEPRLTSDQLARIARLNKGTSINTIEFGFGAQVTRDNFLEKLAKQNAGQHVYVDIQKLAKPRAK